MDIGVIITTYNQPKWLQKVLWGYEVQTDNNFELLIADDGSSADTRKIIDDFRKNAPFPVRHIFHEDKGFRKCTILNKAIVQSKSDYLIFSDGDCIPRNDFVAVHRAEAEPKRFLSGGYFKMSQQPSNAINKERILAQKPFQIKWLVNAGQRKQFGLIKLAENKCISYLMNKLTPTRASWNGHNSSGWKSDLLKVNGYNEDMQYGGLDRELGERLENAGIKGKQIRYKAICVHLNHPRPYRTGETLSKNRKIRDEVAEKGIVVTPNGIKKMPR
ncbi:MAG: glycosyltransferase [Saprospirales bacterium]|nr:MAG: glycosyltransferase [Saprospirales bacterium]